MNIREQREAVVKEALTWLYTPFFPHAHVKGAGVDCAWLLADSYNVSLNMNIIVWPYPTQWFLHKDRTPPIGRNYKTDEWYIEDLQSLGFIEIDESKKDLGDVTLSLHGRAFCHGGIIIGWPKVIHAESSGRQVIIVSALTDSYFVGNKVKFFSRKEWHETN